MRLVVLIAATFAAAGLWTLPAEARLSDDQVKAQMIKESIADYSGNCPCPYNSMRNGRSCGGRSAWSRPGGESPLCYKEDITPAMVKAWREANEG
ncbi:MULTISPECIES: hypothetical protein [Franconibacter]|uniref:Hemolysin n=2 Tax=Franconibacter TaxID=1649295 RepID=C7C5C4_9ENTR|nr:hypothetical protein [Franconibacter pulveris]CAZ90592.1 hypothetical protein [Franconibacter pulveris]